MEGTGGAASAKGGAAAPGGPRPPALGGMPPPGPAGLRLPDRAAAGIWHSAEMRTASPVLVGRADQLAVLDAALAPARREGPSVVLVGGEAGVGKARLVGEFRARAPDARGRARARGCGGPGTDGPPFAPCPGLLCELGPA